MEESTSYSDWQKKTVLTYFVSNARDSGAHLSLQEIIDRAPPYTRIVLKAGTYLESFTISKPVEIIGDTGDEPLITTKGPCITVFGETECYLASLKVRVRTLVAGSNASRAEPPAIQVSNGRPTIVKCEISSIHCGGASHPIVERCFITGNRTGSGVLLRDVASGEFRNNEITSHALYAVEIISRGTPLFALNDIHCRHDDPDCLVGHGLVKIGGLTCDPGDIRPIFENNRIGDYFNESQRASGAVFKNSSTGAAATSTQEKDGGTRGKKSISAAEMRQMRAAISVDCASPKITELVLEGGVIGIFLTSKAGGVIAGSTITQSMLCGVFGDKSAETVIKTTKITQSGGGGVFMDNCSLLFSECNIAGSRGPGVTIRECPHACIEHTYVEKNKSGIACSGVCGGIFTSNHIMNNGLYAIRCSEPGCSPKLKDNTILVNGPVGVHVQDGAAPRLTGNTIAGSQVGLVVDTAACPVVVDNSIANNEQVNVLVEKNGRGVFTENKITGAAVAGVKIADGGNPTFRQNDILECSGCGVLVVEGGIGQFFGNRIRSHSDGVHVALFADPVVEGNEVTNCSRYGVVVDEEGIGTFVGNKLSQNNTNIACINGGEGVFRANEILGALSNGGYMGEGSTALIEKNFFSGSASNNLVLHGAESACTVLHNTFRAALGIGVVSEEGAKGVVRHCQFSGNKGGGMGTQSGGDTLFEHNACFEERGPGIISTDGGKGRFYRCEVERGYSSGCVIATGGDPFVEDCVFKQNAVHGLDVRSGARGLVKKCVATESGISGLQFLGECKTKVEEFVAFANRENGVALVENAVCTLEGCISRNQKVGLRAVGAGASTVLKCTFVENDVGASIHNGGAATISKCKFERSRDVGVEITENGSATLLECHISGGAHGLRSKGKGAGVVQNCKIEGCTSSGVLYESHGNTTVQDTTVTQCKEGVHCGRNGEGTVQRCEIHHNVASNVCAEAHSITQFVANQLHHAIEGFNVDCFGDITMSDSSIHHGALGGIFCGSLTHAKFLSNDISRNGKHGVVCGERSEAELRGNDVTHNALCGVKLEKVAGCLLAENKIHHNQCFGVMCAPSSGGKLEKNEISSNKFANVRLMYASTTQFHSNNIISGEPFGVVVEAGSNLLELNTFQQHGDAAIYVVGQSNATFSRNFVFCNTWGVVFEKRGVHELLEKYLTPELREALDVHVGPRRNTDAPMIPAAATFVTGTELLESAQGSQQHQQAQGTAKRRLGPDSSATLAGNDFYNNRGCAVKMCDGANATITQNVFHDDEIGIQCVAGARGKIEGNTFKDNVCGVSIVGDHISTRVAQNLFDRNQIGISCSENKVGIDELSIVENRFTAAKKCGVKLANETCVALAHNEFRGGLAGIVCDTGARGSAASNTFSDCDVGVHLLSRTNMSITRNHFASGNEIGLLCSAGGGDVTHNVFSHHHVAGVCIEENGAANISKNLFASNTATDITAGVLCRNGGSADVFDNDFHENSVGIRAHNNGTSEFRANFLHDNVYGVYCSTGGAPVLTRCSMSQNSKADVYSFAGGKPTVTHCLFHNTALAFHIDRRGGGVFSRNIIKDCEGTAVCIDLDSLARVKEEEDSNHSGRSSTTSPHENYLAVNGFTATALSLQEASKLPTSRSRSGSGSGGAGGDATPTFSENYIVGCGVGIELDCGTPYSRKKRRSSLAPPGTLQTESSFASPLSARPSFVGRGDGNNAGAGGDDGGAAATLERMSSMEGRRRRFDYRDYRSPMPDLMALLRLQYNGFVAHNVILNCQQGIVVRNGPTDAMVAYSALMSPNYLLPSAVISAAQQQLGSSGTGSDLLLTASPGQHPLGVASEPSGFFARADSGGPADGGADGQDDYEDEDGFGGLAPVPAQDQLQMVMFEGNTVSGCEWGIVVRGGGSARFQRNVVQKSNRGGIMIVDEGRGEFFRNVVRECGAVGILVTASEKGGGAAGPASPSAAGSPFSLSCLANFQENMVVGSRSNVTIACGEVRFHKNVMHSGEVGMTLSEAATGLFDSNVVFNNRRGGCITASELVVLVGNHFYSPADQGAMDIRADNYKLPQGNTVKNQFQPRWNKKDPAVKTKLPAEVSESKYAQAQSELFDALRKMHEAQLPQCAVLGCAKIGVENSLLAAVTAMRLAGRMMTQVAVPSIPVVEPEVTLPAARRAAAAAAAGNSTGGGLRRKTATASSAGGASTKTAADDPDPASPSASASPRGAGTGRGRAGGGGNATSLKAVAMAARSVAKVRLGTGSSDAAAATAGASSQPTTPGGQGGRGGPNGGVVKRAGARGSRGGGPNPRKSAAAADSSTADGDEDTAPSISFTPTTTVTPLVPGLSKSSDTGATESSARGFTDFDATKDVAGDPLNRAETPPFAEIPTLDDARVDSPMEPGRGSRPHSPSRFSAAGGPSGAAHGQGWALQGTATASLRAGGGGAAGGGAGAHLSAGGARAGRSASGTILTIGDAAAAAFSERLTAASLNAGPSRSPRPPPSPHAAMSSGTPRQQVALKVHSLVLSLDSSPAASPVGGPGDSPVSNTGHHQQQHIAGRLASAEGERRGAAVAGTVSPPALHSASDHERRILEEIHRQNGTKFIKRDSTLSGGGDESMIAAIAPWSIVGEAAPGSRQTDGGGAGGAVTPSRTKVGATSPTRRGHSPHLPRSGMSPALPNDSYLRQRDVEVAVSTGATPAMVALDPRFSPQPSALLPAIERDGHASVAKGHAAAGSQLLTAGDSAAGPAVSHMTQFQLEALLPAVDRKEGSATATLQSLKIRQLVQQAQSIGESSAASRAKRILALSGGGSGHTAPQPFDDFIGLPRAPRTARDGRRPRLLAGNSPAAAQVPTARLSIDEALSGRAIRRSGSNDSSEAERMSSSGARPLRLQSFTLGSTRRPVPQGEGLPLALSCASVVDGARPRPATEESGARRRSTARARPRFINGRWVADASDMSSSGDDDESGALVEGTQLAVPFKAMRTAAVGRTRVASRDVELGRFSRHGAVERFVPWTTLERAASLSSF